ncbi:hypothetical protein HHI36_004076 [Cryptolaemus montrouzieri]|uniref:Uncharacterized protein n=1 Tax=Cryptolaemus montrouzieri TaxID=559131 RepID=A0ABD2NQQ8_9CUCU
MSSEMSCFWKPSKWFFLRLWNNLLRADYHKIKLPHQLKTRNATQQNKLVPTVRSSNMKRHISFRGPKIYNMLPPHLRVGPYKKVKNKVDRWIIDNHPNFNP